MVNFSDFNVVSIDDNKNNLFLIESICHEMGLQTKSFSDSLEALLHVIKNPVDMVLIDYMMPNLNGIEFVKEFRKKNSITPIVMVTAMGNDDGIHKEAFDAGVNDFLRKPVNATILKARVNTLLINYSNRLFAEDRAKFLEKEVQKATKAIKEREFEALYMLVKTAEYKDNETAEHISRVAKYAKMIAKYYELDKKEQEIIYRAAPFHDLGKVGIADNILLKPGKFTTKEYEVMKTHAQIGYDILKDSKSEYLQAGAVIAIAHHEKYNGQGYPKGLKGKDIPLYGRVVAIADVFDALTSKRPYKEAWSFEEAIGFLKGQRGEHFDAQLVDIFLKHAREVREIFDIYGR